jgi:hypothetical protein
MVTTDHDEPDEDPADYESEGRMLAVCFGRLPRVAALRTFQKRSRSTGNRWSLQVRARVAIVGIPNTWRLLSTRGYGHLTLRTGVRFSPASTLEGGELLTFVLAANRVHQRRAGRHVLAQEIADDLRCLTRLKMIGGGLCWPDASPVREVIGARCTRRRSAWAFAGEQEVKVKNRERFLVWTAFLGCRIWCPSAARHD